MVLYFNSLLLPVMCGYAEPARIRAPFESRRGAFPSPPPPGKERAFPRRAGGQ